MCGIVDVNVLSEVFSSDKTTAGKIFFEWIDTGKGCLVVGGKLLDELSSGSEGFRRWAKTARSSGRLRIANRNRVDARTDELRIQRVCRSNDHHIIALAQITDTRLLYTKDQSLINDFTDGRLLNNPSGRVYPRRTSRGYDNRRRNLLRDTRCVRSR